MPRRVDCPFCGQDGIRTKEHVWAQWLRDTEPAKVLLDATHGERIPKPTGVLRRGDDGRYAIQSMPAGQYAKWLPNVTVDVCQDCNNGWMSILESQAKNLVEPFFRTGRAIRLTAADLTVLTVWATKSWMAYALARPQQGNPFTISEYRHLAERQTPLERSMVWLMHSQDDGAHVGIGVSPGLLTKGPPPDGLDAQDNSGFAYLAADSLVMFMSLPPPGAPDGMAEQHFTPPVVTTKTVRRAWPAPRPQYFPLGEVPPGALAALLRYPDQFWENLGLPTVGLTDDDAQQVMHQFLDGANPTALRKEWERKPNQVRNQPARPKPDP